LALAMGVAFVVIHDHHRVTGWLPGSRSPFPAQAPEPS
jgi:hypothetical protein